MVIESHSGMSSLGRLYGFGLPLTDDAEFLAGAAEDVAKCSDELDTFAGVAEDEFASVSEDELVAEKTVAVSLKELIWGLDFGSKDSVNEFIGVNCLSNKSSASVAENAPKIAMINRIFVCIYLEIGHWSMVTSHWSLVSGLYWILSVACAPSMTGSRGGDSVFLLVFSL